MLTLKYLDDYSNLLLTTIQDLLAALRSCLASCVVLVLCLLASKHVLMPKPGSTRLDELHGCKLRGGPLAPTSA